MCVLFQFCLRLHGGVAVLLFGGTHYAFAASICTCVLLGMSRPVSTHLILEQVETDIGSASSFMVFYNFMLGSLHVLLHGSMVQTHPGLWRYRREPKPSSLPSGRV